MIFPFGIIIFSTLIIFFFCPVSISSQRTSHYHYSTANLSTSWRTLDDVQWYGKFSDSRVAPILLRRTLGPIYGCGFYWNTFWGDSLMFAIFTVQINSSGIITDRELGFPHVVWSAKLNNKLTFNATLELTAEGDLVLRNANGTLAWSTNTAGKAVVGLNLTETGNLVLFDANTSVVWQSFDHPSDYPTANLSTLWINRFEFNRSVSFGEGTTSITPILLRGALGLRYACGFYRNGSNSFMFSIFIVQTDRFGYSYGLFPQVVWSANRNNPVGENASLQLTAEGDLVLRDADGSLAWATNTAGRSVAGLNLTEMGNLVLFDSNNSVVWQSFDHPTDCLLPGQILLSGKNLTTSASSNNLSVEGGLFSVSMTERGLVASILSDPPQVYYTKLIRSTKQNKEAISYAKFQNGNLDLYVNGGPDISKTSPAAASSQYLKLGADGHLRVFKWSYPTDGVADLLTGRFGECGYPMVCGKFGMCSNGQCRRSCPGSSSNGASFRPVINERPDLGCSEVTPLTCTESDDHRFLDLEYVTYFSFIADISDTDMNSCKEACLKNCSCRAAIFRYNSDPSSGDCYLPSQVFSLIDNEDYLSYYNTSVSLKVQIAPTRKTSSLGPILGSTLGIIFAAIVVVTMVYLHRKRRKSEEVEEDYLDNVPGMPTRFSFEELTAATDNFNKKLGEGGFGSVFEGSFSDGTRIAVKRLDGFGHIKKSFIAEVQTIGSIHHINLVRLIGFCAEKSHRLLVYEYMCNGSLERWIYCRSHESMLEWSHRRKIILDIARGLAYLHEECRQKIIHLDIKPQNILLDEHYNAKLSDFGLSKLIDRNQSNVITTMRGTPGYLAPEWLSAVITEKVDVYSFGVVILEILCGRKIFEQSRGEEERHLPTLFMRKAEEGLWLDLADKCCQDVESNVAQVVVMMQIAALCLQSDHEKRPSMSMVIKILEGVVDVQQDISFNVIPHYLVSRIPEVGTTDVTRLHPSVLSGPR